MKRFGCIIIVAVLLSISGNVLAQAPTKIVKSLSKAQKAGMVASKTLQAGRNIPGGKGGNKWVRPVPPGPGPRPIGQIYYPDSLNSSLRRMLEQLEKDKKTRDILKKIREENSPDAQLRRSYPIMKDAIERGLFDRMPARLLYWGGYARSQGDTVFAENAYKKAKSNYLTVDDVETCIRTNKGYADKRNDLLTYIVERNFVACLTDDLVFDSDSATMHHRDVMIKLAEEYEPGLVPLIKITYSTDSVNDFSLYHEAVDSLCSGSLKVRQDVEEPILCNFLYFGLQNDQYKLLIDYSGREPLKSFVDSDANACVILSFSCLYEQDEEKGNAYLQRAYDLDNEIALDFVNRMFEENYKYLVDNPGDEEIVDYILEATDCPVQVAYCLFEDITDKYFPFNEEEYYFLWHYIHDYNFAEQKILKDVLSIARKALKIETDQTEDIYRMALIECVAMTICYDNGEVENAKKYIDYIDNELFGKSGSGYDDMRAAVIIDKAYIAGHGLDRPKEAYKILKKNLKEFDRWDLSPLTRQQRYRYLQQVCEAMGKHKKADEYKKIADSINLHPDE